MNFAVDELKRAGSQDAIDDSWFLADDDAGRIQAILQRTDFSKIGLMGHSMGGATSVALGRERNDISAVIDIDGTMLSEYTGVENGELIVREEAYDCPLLEFINWESYNDQREYRAQGGRYPNDILMQQAAAGFTTTIRDTGHMDFTDLPLLSPFLGNMLGSGERDTAETMTIVNSLVLQFFNCYLKGEGTFSIEEVY
jgi:pimeloyl-ACP methyl ester carboxylesterase